MDFQGEMRIESVDYNMVGTIYSHFKCSYLRHIQFLILRADRMDET